MLTLKDSRFPGLPRGWGSRDGVLTGSGWFLMSVFPGSEGSEIGWLELPCLLLEGQRLDRLRQSDGLGTIDGGRGKARSFGTGRGGEGFKEVEGAPLFGERVQVHLILASSLSEAAEVMKRRREIVQALEYRIWWVNWQFLAQMRLIGLRAAILYKASRYPSAFDPAILDENLPLNCTSHVRMHELYSL
jgi:hypothetical protein